MVEISPVKKMAVLINFYCTNDKNKDGVIEEDEVKGSSKIDRDGDGAASPWEVMEITNAEAKKILFSSEEIAAMRKLNQSGKNFDKITPDQDTEICGIPFKKGEEIFFHGNGSIGSGKLAEDKALMTAAGHRITFRRGETIYFDKEGRASFGTLIQRTTIHGKTYEAGSWIYFHENGNVRHGKFAKDELVNGVTYQAGTEINFYNNGSVKSGMLASNITINGKTFKPGGKQIVFHENGNIEFGVLFKEENIQGVNYGAGSEVGFYKNGQVDTVILAASTIIQGMRYEAGTKVIFYESGELRDVYLTADFTVQGMPFMHITHDNEPDFICGPNKCRALSMFGYHGPDIGFHRNGKVSWGALARDIVVKHKTGATKIDLKLKAKAEVRFYENGELESGKLAEETAFDIKNKKINFAPSGISFYANGEVEWGFLAKEIEINGYKFKAQTRMEIYENGRVRAGTLAEDTAIHGYNFKAGTYVKFHENGRIEAGSLAEDAEINNIKRISMVGREYIFIKMGRSRKECWPKTQKFRGIVLRLVLILNSMKMEK